MYKPLSKVLIVMTMLIAFIGQTLAYSAMACEMAGDAHQAHTMMVNGEETMSHHLMDRSSSDHGNMNHPMASQGNPSSSDDCCGVDCICPANACTSFTLLSTPTTYVDLVLLNEALNLLPIEQPSSLPTSLYRPPIFA